MWSESIAITADGASCNQKLLQMYKKLGKTRRSGIQNPNPYSSEN